MLPIETLSSRNKTTACVAFSLWLPNSTTQAAVTVSARDVSELCPRKEHSYIRSHVQF